MSASRASSPNLAARAAHAVRRAAAVVGAQRAGALLRQGIAVALAVRGAHERRHDVEVPVGDLTGFAPEVGQPEIDVQLEQIDA